MTNGVWRSRVRTEEEEEKEEDPQEPPPVHKSISRGLLITHNFEAQSREGRLLPGIMASPHLAVGSD